MSIALESSRNGIERSGFVPVISPCISIFDSPEPSRKLAGEMLSLDRRTPAKMDDSDSCSSSSIGRNSDCSGGSASDGEDSGEVQSSYKGPLDTMDALEDSLPIRRSISDFYFGKSKSFTSLADASSAKDLGKPDNAYNRKRKNLMACSNFLDKNRSGPLRNSGGGITKRSTNSNRRSLAVAFVMSSSDSNSSDDHEPRLPPLHPQGKSPSNVSPPQTPFSSRSFSLTDLQAASSSSSICLRSRQKKFH